MKEIAIIGPTASGKSALAIDIANHYGAAILSLDSLSIYKEIDIVSAKPTKGERGSIPHFGIDLLYPDEYFSVERFIRLYKEARELCIREKRDLIIVGGSLFYLKALQQGLSEMPTFSHETQQKVKQHMEDIEKAYRYLEKIDEVFAKKITSRDRYRIEKGLLIYYQTGLTPTRYFQAHPPKKIITDIPIFSIEIERDLLRRRLRERTKMMIERGLIEEVYSLEKRYTRSPNPMKAIGIVETLEYLDGKLNLLELEEKIVVNSARLAKRQQTFIKTQFENVIKIAPHESEAIERFLED